MYPWQSGNRIGMVTGWIDERLFIVKRRVYSSRRGFALDTDERLFVWRRMVRSRNFIDTKNKQERVILMIRLVE